MPQQSEEDPRSATVRRYREAAAARVENTSLRRVAGEIGMSATGLRKFLLGAEPYAPTVRRLRSWYLRYGTRPQGRVAEADASAAVELLVHDLPPGSRGRAAAAVLESLARGFDASGRSRPRWVAELRARYGADPSVRA